MAGVPDLFVGEGIGGMVAVVGAETAFHYDLLELITVSLHPHVADAGDIHESADGLVAHERDLHDGLSLLARYHKVAVGIAHATAEEGGILRIEQLDVGELHGQVVVVYQPAYQLAVSLSGTLHGDKAVAHGHLHRVVADDLADGVGQVVRMDVLGYGKVFQFIIDEADLVASGSLAEVDEDIRHAAVVIVANDTLGTCRGHEDAQQEYQDGYFSHSDMRFRFWEYTL